MTRLSPKIKPGLARKLSLQPSVLSFHHDPLLSSALASLGLVQEVGHPTNDELLRHMKDPFSGQEVKKLQAEMVTHQGKIGVRIEGDGPLHCDHPHLSRIMDFENTRSDQMVFFPSDIAHHLAAQGIEVVIYRPWAENSVLTEVDPNQSFYMTNLWEIQNNDALSMAKLLAKRQLVFLGTHDLVAHVAGASREAWDFLEALAQDLIPELDLEPGFHQSLPHLLLTYLIGVVLDDLAQPRNDRETGRLRAIGLLREKLRWAKAEVPPQEAHWEIPPEFSAAVETTRTNTHLFPQALNTLMTASQKKVG